MVRRPDGARSWRSDRPPDRGRPRYLWKTDTPRGHRGPTRFWLLAAALFCAGAFASLLLYLARPPRPCFVAVSTDPTADALRLDAPLDLLGRRSAERFLDGAARWTRRAGHVEAGPVRLSTDRDELRKWVRSFQKYDPVVMYFGVQCSVSDWYGTAPEADPKRTAQPVLHVGGGKRLPVRDLLETVSAELPRRRVIILLDSGRLRPDPALGHLRDDFVNRVTDVFNEVQRAGGADLVVMCGTGEGQRGWESEELGATAFARSIIGAFDEADGRTDVRTVRELFDEASDRLRTWSANNRPTIQAPVLLTGSDGGRARAAEIRIAVRPTGEPPVRELVPLSLPKEWSARWDKHDQLARQAPHPATYAPRQWRRYQELLLRYDAAVRVGDQAVTARLDGALRDAEGTLAHPLGLVFRPERAPARPFGPGTNNSFPPSLGQSLAFAAVTGAEPPDPTESLRRYVRGSSEALPAAVESPDGRPSEWHLASMVRRFYHTVAKSGAVPAEWDTALEVRVRADRAALGLPAPGRPLIRADGWSGRSAAALSERVWPVVREPVAAADKSRRSAEDRLFGPAPDKVEFAFRRQFEPATDRAADVRFAFHVRDIVCADLPYLGRWTISDGAGEALALWPRVHELDRHLLAVAEQEPSALAAEAGAVWSAFTKLRDQFDHAVREQTGAALQKTWLPKEELLATPLLGTADRERLLTASRNISFDLLTKPSGPATGANTRASAGSAGAGIRAQLALAELGPMIGRPPEPAPEAGTDPTAVGARVAAAYRDLSPLGSDELASRRAVPFQPDTEPWREPAAANARKQWSDLLDGLATRTLADHWDDENSGRGRPYYARVADAYREDAAALQGRPAVRTPYAAPLTVAPTDGAGSLWWTSELRRTVSFTLMMPQRKAPGERSELGEAVLLRTLTGSAAVRYDPKVAGPARALVPIREGQEETIPFTLVTSSEDEAPSTATATAGAYFRGQFAEAVRPVTITRRPELVITDSGPPSADAAIAIRADPTQPLPPVVVLLDYSGSMKEGLNGFKLPGPENAWKDGPSKFNIALKRLEGVLAELPKGTPLRVRLFSARGVADEDAVVYPKPGESAVADWRGDDDARLKDLIDRLRRYEPSGTTPLMRSIMDAARFDFPDRADGPKTLVVLTDGADDSGQPGTPKESRDDLRTDLKNALKATGVKLVVVQLALNEADRAISKELFADLPNLDVPGEVVSVEDSEGLRRELAAALWPKLVLTGARPSGPGRYPPVGWPARPTAAPRGARGTEGDIDPNTLLWSPALAPGSYSARVAGYPAGNFPKVSLAAGDFLSLSLAHTSDGFALRRELHADTFGRGFKAFREDNRWVLSVVPSGIGDAREEPAFGTVALLEKVPAHRLGRARDKEDPLRHTLPDALWWHVGPATDAPPTGVPVGSREGTRTVVSRLYGYPAPAWDLRVEGWPRTPNGPGFEPATVRAWVPVLDPTLVPVPRVHLPRPGSEETVSLGTRSFRVTIEPQRFADAVEPVECLVIRTEYQPGEPVLLRLAGAAPEVRTEHRYFRNANSYTAVFGPGAVPPGATNVQFQLVQVREFVTDPGAVIRLNPPAPALGRRPDGYRPAPSKVAP